MPTYEYECSKCKKTFDAFQQMSAEVYQICPEELCQKKPWGKGKVKRLLGAGAGLIFKGSGFYITDYRSEGYKTAAKSDSSSGSSSKEAPSAAKNSTESNSSKSSETKSASSSSSTPAKNSSAGKAAGDKKKKA